MSSFHRFVPPRLRVCGCVRGLVGGASVAGKVLMNFLKSSRRGLATFLLALLGTVAVRPQGLQTHHPKTVPADRPRTLVVAVDAVPFQVMADLVSSEAGDGALFDGFRGPVPLISTFPSTTTVAFTGILEPLGIDSPPGYEARFFDWNHREVRGGGPRSYFKIVFSWREFFHWKTRSTVRKTLGFVHPVKFGRQEVKRAVKAFLASDRDVFLAYVTATDGVGHVKGPAFQARVLRELGEALRELDSEGGKKFHSVVLSDHGMGGGKPLKNVWKEVRREARSAGFHIAGRLEGERDLVFVPYGLVSSFVAFTSPGWEARAAGALASAPGVSLCVHRDGSGWRVVGDGEARVGRRRRGSQWQWSYQPLTGDPLEYGPRLAQLRRLHAGARRQAGDAVWFSQAAWFDATREGAYPDALHRIARGFDLVTNPASVVCSVAPGHMYGAPLTAWASRFIGRLKWTHGALDRDAAAGFIMSDHPDWPQAPAWPFDEALSFLTGIEGAALDEPGRIYQAYFD